MADLAPFVFLVIERSYSGEDDELRFASHSKRDAIAEARRLRWERFRENGYGRAFRVEEIALDIQIPWHDIVWSWNPNDFADYRWERRSREQRLAAAP